jgi:aminomethyltransferase
MLVVNASNIRKDFDWLQSHLEDGTRLKDFSDHYGLLAVQGPRAQKMMETVSSFDFESLPYYHSAVMQIGGHSVLFSRTGYTGEDGFEIYIPSDIADHIWATITEAGKKFNMQFIGLGARDSLRMEMKMALYGNDIDKTTTPIEAGLAWVVKFDKGRFISREILERQKNEKPSRRLICLELEGKAFPRTGYDLVHADETVGKVTSGTFSPSLNRPIALGYLPLPLTKIGNVINVRIRDKLFPAQVVKPPFYKEGTHR